ncbi:MAG: sodium-dependent transporter [Xanthomonadales bacterium]|nr:sodium-dependent transporter [Xanthomonadales bacterium]
MLAAERFTSRLSAWLALVGVAVGLGNVWRFPYMMGAHGGSAFLFLYLALIVLFAIPLLSGELALGRALRAGVIESYRSTWGRRAGTVLGGILSGAILVASSYYLVVIGNIAYLAWFGLAQGFDAEHSAGLSSGLGNGHLQYAIAVTIMLVACAVLSRGVQRGIELASRTLVPFFGLLVIYVIGHALTLPGIGAQIGAFLQPDFTTIGIADVYAALGQAFFSVGVGGTFMVVYGSYLKDQARLPRLAMATALGDTAAALLAALFIVPTILYFSLDMAQGPGLIFSTLPKLFALMPAGQWVGALFLIAFTLMAFLSAMAGLEVCVSATRDLSGDRLGRRGAVLVVAVLELILIWPSAQSPALIGTLDLIFGSGMQIFGALIAVLTITFWVGKPVAQRQIFGGEAKGWLRAYWWWLRWALPVMLLAVLVGYVIDSI